MNSKILIFTIIFLLGCYYIYSTCKNVTEPFDTNSILTDTKNICQRMGRFMLSLMTTKRIKYTRSSLNILLLKWKN